MKNALIANHIYSDLLATSVFYQLFLFVIVTGVLRNYLQWSTGLSHFKLLHLLKMLEDFVSVFVNHDQLQNVLPFPRLLLFDFL